MKKFFAIVLFVVAGFLAIIGLMVCLPQILQSFLILLKEPDAHQIGYFMGTFLFFTVITGIAIVISLYGAKLIKRQAVKPTEISEEY